MIPVPALAITGPADLAHLPELLAAVTDQARSAGLDPAQVDAVELAVEEALVNVIEHAYVGTPGDVTIRAARLPSGGLSVEIEDSGPAFDPLGLPDPDLTADLADRSVGGLGVHFIKSLAADAAYRRENGRNILALRFPAGTPREVG